MDKALRFRRREFKKLAPLLGLALQEGFWISECNVRAHGLEIRLGVLEIKVRGSLDVLGATPAFDE